MFRHFAGVPVQLLAVVLTLLAVSGSSRLFATAPWACRAEARETPARGGGSGGTYDQPVILFREWRAFERPTFVNGVPDYTKGAMAAQHRALPEWQARLERIDRKGWPVPQ